MIPAFVIHHPTTTARDTIVADLVKKTGAEIVEAILLPHGPQGCTMSHLKVAQLAHEKYPTERYYVFEDDAVLENGWDDIVKLSPSADVIFLGYTNDCEDCIFGTHGLCLSPKARDVFIAHAQEAAFEIPERHRWATDWIVTLLCKKYDLVLSRPTFHNRDRWCYQKKGLKSLITKKIRT